MQALRKMAAAPGVALGEVPEPKAAAGEVLIEVAAAGICGSDLHIDHWNGSYDFIAPALPVTLGHELSGRVVAAGAEVRALSAGQSVVVMPSVTCGVCAHCRARDRDHCTNRKGIGMTRDGGFARLVAVPEQNCLVVPDSIDPAVAALTEPLTVAWQAVQRGGVSAGSRVLVLGPGTIGQGIALMAREAGAAEVVVAGRNDRPRLGVVHALGFAETFDLAEAGANGELVDLAGEGFDVVLEATGAGAAIQSGLDRLRVGGVLVAAGIHGVPAAFDVTRLVRRQQDIRGSYRSPLAAWPKVVAMLIANPAAFAPMVTHRIGLADGLAAFALAHRREASKVALLP